MLPFALTAKALLSKTASSAKKAILFLSQLANVDPSYFLECHPSCLNCSGNTADDCAECASGFSLYEQTCVSECPQGHTSVDKICESKLPFT